MLSTIRTTRPWILSLTTRVASPKRSDLQIPTSSVCPTVRFRLEQNYFSRALKERFEHPDRNDRQQRPLRRLINLSRSEQATKRQPFPCSFLNIFNLLSFGNIADSEPCPRQRVT